MDGELQTGTAWPTPRFTDNSLINSTEKTVTDNLTGLIWSKNANLAEGGKKWQKALDYVKALNGINFSGHNDWRLPNINELSSLAITGQTDSTTWLNGHVFENVQSDRRYWSATSVKTDSAWFFGMDLFSVSSNYKAFDYYVWPVRGGVVSLQLSVTKSGTGSGNVTSPVGSINCGSSCSAKINTGASVTLTATPDSGSTFTGWTGSCRGTGTCTVTMDAAKSITAAFIQTYTITANVTGSNGTVSCTSPTNYGATSACTITPASGYQLATFTDNSVDKIGSVVSGGYNIANVTTNHTVVATFSDSQKPVVSAFTIPATGTSLTVPVSTFTATDNAAVSGYLLTESASAPAATDAGWNATKPTSYAFTGIAEGIATPKTLYAWAKDAAGNVTEANNSSGCSWSATTPSSYPFTTSGTKTLYAWTKDAIGNISLPVSATVSTVIATSKPGDSDADGNVSIAEVQSAINMFLGLKAAEGYVDQDGVGGVSIAEVQKVINSFLGL